MVRTVPECLEILCATNKRSTLETDEGLDKKLSLHYYSRMRFLTNLMPQLTKAGMTAEASSTTPAQPGLYRSLSRVVSVLEAGGEAPLILDDLTLNSLRNCAKHAITMTSLSMEHLACLYPTTSFVHAYPGLVQTGLMRDFGAITRTAMSALFVLARPWMVPLDESGERHLYAATSPRFPPRASKDVEGAAPGADGAKGSGAYLLHWDGSDNGNRKPLQDLRKNETGKLVWQHTMEVFESICGKTTS